MKVVTIVILNDVFPDGITGEGIFYALNEYNVPWKTAISSIALDLEYYGNVSGGKNISPLLRRLLIDGVLPQSAITKLANALYSMNALRWVKLWNTYELEYNPIENYRMSEIMSDDDTVTTYGRTHRKTGTESDDRTRTDQSTEGVYGFNSSSESDSETSDRTIDDDNTHTYDLSDADTGTDTQSHSYELTRSGNIGVTTSQQMIESERALWMWRYFYDVVFPDVDKMFTIAIYSDDYTPSISGGITPIGDISIVLNGDYDVAEYANAIVNVPNTYRESDEGLVVYNGELVSQIGRDISANGSYDTTLNNAVIVNVPNTYTAGDEGRVVSNGVLVNQSSKNITSNGSYDTTLFNNVNVNVEYIPDELLSFNVKKLAGLTANNVVYASDGAHFESTSAYLKVAQSAVNKNITLELDVDKLQLTDGTHRRFIMSEDNTGFIYRATGVWGLYIGSNTWNDSDITDGNYFDDSIVGVYIDSSNKWHIYKNGVVVFEPTGALSLSYGFWIGSNATSINNGIISGIRMYYGNKYNV